MTLRLLSALVLVVALSGCVGVRPRPLGLDERPADRVAVPTSSLHYRGYADADALARALRYTTGAERLVSAHRGAPVEGLPENAVPTFEHTLNYAPALIELDVRRTADGVLMLMHDETLDRTTTGQGRVDATPFAAVRALRLLDVRGVMTSFRVPTLAEALAWAEGRAIIMLDVKEDVPYPELVAAVRAAGAENRVVVIVYSLDDHRAVGALAPDLNVSATVETLAETEALLASGVDLSRTIAFVGVGRADPAVVARLHAAGIRAQVGTFPLDATADAATNPSVYTPFLDADADVLSTDNIRSASEAIRAFTTARR
ncbi:MAG TPA: glycerophosphodiester phosphodiesterase family protein [Rubricoccaceae bacterium]|jgi:glycerophosphoryl diester phosphodiesterase